MVILRVQEILNLQSTQLAISKKGKAYLPDTNHMPDPLDPTKTLIFQDNNFQDEIYKNALWQNYYVGIDGGSESVRYNASAGYTDDGGVVLASRLFPSKFAK